MRGSDERSNEEKRVGGVWKQRDSKRKRNYRRRRRREGRQRGGKSGTWGE